MRHPAVIAFTGGPRGGKTEALRKSYELFKGEGVGSSFVPEVATCLMQTGYHPTDSYNKNSADWDRARVNLQITWEDQAILLAQAHSKPHIVLADRGILDGQAFCPSHIWAETMSSFNLSQRTIFARYDAVIHLVSTAVDLPDDYDNKSNPFRYHNAQQAKESDIALGKIWGGHPKYIRIDNSTDFKGKLDRTMSAIRQLIDKPETPSARSGLGKVVTMTPQARSSQHVR